MSLDQSPRKLLRKTQSVSQGRLLPLIYWRPSVVSDFHLPPSVVMVCNHGQSELLMNFVCAANARKLDLSAVLVFATDEETKDIAEGLGLTAFFDKMVSVWTIG
jgi:hypothetical protein